MAGLIMIRMKQPWLISRYYPSIYTEKLKTITVNLRYGG
jgi:hypothetical protein